MATEMDRVCPACNAQPHSVCTQPTSTGRIGVPWLHEARLQDDGEPTLEQRLEYIEARLKRHETRLGRLEEARG